jgi:hypothetical protein
MKNTNAGDTTVSHPVLSPSSRATGECPTAPEQIWGWLTPSQQQRVFQVVVRVCHQMVVDCHQEVCHEQP